MKPLRILGLDVVINNAAALHPIARVEDADIDAWSKLIDINVKGVFYAAKAALPHLMKSGEGIILTVSSGAAHNPLEGWSAYCASKSGGRHDDPQYASGIWLAWNFIHGSVAWDRGHADAA